MALQQIGLDATLNNVPDFTSGIDKMNKAVDSFAQQGAESGNMFQKGFGEIVTGALREIGTIAIDALAKGGQAVAGFLKDSVGVAGDFQQEFAQFQIAVGHTIDGTGLKLDDFKKQFISLGKELPVSTAEVEQAAVEMARGGIDPAVIAAGGLRQTIQFASAALKGDLVQAAQISAKTMQAWTSITDSAATKTDFLTHAQNLMTQATTAASTTVDQLFLGLSNVGGTARIAGVSFDETVKALAQLTPSFASSADAGTSLKTFFARLQPETKPAIAAMQELGLWTEQSGSAFYDAQGKFIGMQAAEDLLQKATSGLTDAQRQQALQTIFGNDAIRAAGVFALQGQAGYDALSESISKQTTLSDAAATNQATYNTAVENAKGSVEALQITIGSALLPILTDLMNNTIAPAVNTVTDWATALIDADDPIRMLTDQIGRFSPLLATVVAAIADFVTSGGDLGVVADDLNEGVSGLGTAFLGLVSAGKIVIGGVQALIGEFGSAGDASNALGNVITDLSGVFNRALKTVQDVGQGYLAIAQSILPVVTQFWQDHGTQITAFLQTAYTKIMSIVNTALDLYDAIVPKVLNSVADWITKHATGIQAVLSGAWQAISGIIDGALTLIEGVIKIALDVIHGDWSKAWTDLQAMSAQFVLDLEKVIEGFLEIIAGFFDTNLQKIGELWSHNWDAIVTYVSNIDWVDVGASVIAGVIDGISGNAGRLYDTLKNLAKDALNAAKSALGISSPSKEFAAVGQFIVEGVLQGLTDAWPTLTDQIGSLADSLVGKMKDIGTQMQDAIASGFGATASIDRQIAKNLDSFKDVLPEYAQYTTGALKQAQDEAQAMLDPAEGAKYFKMRSDQILEYAKLQKQLSEAQNADDQARIKQQMLLINQAQTAEIGQFNATAQAQSPLLSIADQINAVMMDISKINLTDNQIQMVNALASIWSTLVAPVQTRSDAYAHPPPAPTVTSTTNLNMPIYSNNSPSAMQDSMAIAVAALP